jgi:signal transduction histidine kinase
MGMAALQGQTEDDRITGEQAALRRVATLVARGAPSEEVFAAVAEETGRLLGAKQATLSRYGSDGITVVASWGDAVAAYPVGSRWCLGGRNTPTLVFQTGRPARIDDYTPRASGAIAEAAREIGVRSTAGVPIGAGGRLWGLAIIASTQQLPADTEARLAGFTELAATAIANAQARLDLHRFADEQAGLRRVATLVARGAPPEKVFTAVTEEAGRLLGVAFAMMGRYDPDGARTVVAAWSSAGPAFPVGNRITLGGRDVSTLVFQTGRPSRFDDQSDVSGPVAEVAREIGLRSTVGVPISVEGRLWGLMGVGSRAGPLPASTEAQLAEFTELAATAIANAEAQAALTASRARIVTAADQSRRRIERDLHDGAQQRLVSLALRLRAAQSAVPAEAGELARQMEGAVCEATGALEELREIARGLHPAILAKGGLRPALTALARRSAVPVHLEIHVAGRLPDQAEMAAYYVVAEALTNAAKHAHATAVDVHVTVGEDMLHARVRDDGLGGADFGHGSGLIGLRDRAEALGGRMRLHSPPGAGTVLEMTLPLRGPGESGREAWAGDDRAAR